MRIAVPQSSENPRVRIVVTGPNTLQEMFVCCDAKVIDRDFDDDDCDLRVTAQFIGNASNLVGDEKVLKEPEVEDEPLDGEFDEPKTTVPESATEPESELLPAPEPERDTVPQADEEGEAEYDEVIEDDDYDEDDEE